MQVNFSYLSVYQAKTCSYCPRSPSAFHCSISFDTILTKLSSIIVVLFWNVIKLRFKILYIRTIRLQWHQAGLTMTSQWSRFLHRRCSSDQGSPSSCKCGGSSLAETEASWPCHYSSTRASPQQGRVCQFHESEGEIKITRWQHISSFTFGRQWYP